MTFLQIQQYLIRELQKYLKLQVLLSEQVGREQPFPYVIYQVSASYLPYNGRGDYTWTAEGEDVRTSRREWPSAIFSFTVNSMDRRQSGVSIFGLNESQEIAERAVGWFLHTGYPALSQAGIVVAEIMNSGNRTFLEVTDVVRQYGFDVRINYPRLDERIDPSIDRVGIKQNERD